jgi:structural maintenance of chromosomes protein 5
VLYNRGKTSKKEIMEAEQELRHLNSQAGQQVNKLRQFSEDTAKAWDWIQKNMDQFEKPIYGPPMIVCSVKDSRYVDLMEALFQKSDLLTITAQTKSDFKKLGDQAYGTMGLADVNIKCQSRDLAQEMQRRPNISEQQLKQFGLDGWASDFLDGPEPVIAMLCSTANLHSTGIALQEITESQYNMISESRIGAWASGKHTYRITRRMEYGAGAMSTMTRNIRQARLWSDQPVDMTAKTEIEDRIRSLLEEHKAMSNEVGPLREKKASLTSERKSLDNEIVSFPAMSFGK